MSGVPREPVSANAGLGAAYSSPRPAPIATPEPGADDDVNSCTREQLRLIGVGYGRTGTNTLSEILTHEFGVKCYNMFEMTKFAGRDGELWKELCEIDPTTPAATQRKHELFDQIFRSNIQTRGVEEEPYLAVLDWPGCKFWRDLVDYYPDAKVLLTVRDASKWYNSVQASVYKYYNLLNSSLLLLMGPVAKYVEPSLYYLSYIFTYCIFDCLPWEAAAAEDNIIGAREDTVSMYGKFEDRDYVTRKFKLHIDAVKRHVGRERLIILDLNNKDGYNHLVDIFADIANRSPLHKKGEKVMHKSAKNFQEKLDEVRGKIRFYDAVLIGVFAVVFFILVPFYAWRTGENGRNLWA